MRSGQPYVREPGHGCRELPEPQTAVEATGAPLRPGDWLDGRFRIRELVYRGGMATIFKAEDTARQNQIVAVKVPHLEYESDAGFFDRFQREEQIGLSLDHPYLLKFVPVKHKSRPYLVTEYVPGCTLADLLAIERPLSEANALDLAGLVCEALQHLHERGVIHRDLKPQNIMLCPDGTIRLMDFGIAKDFSSRGRTLFGNALALGTADYMAPEQVRRQSGDARTDLYSLGAILYEMLTGVPPFQNEDPWAALKARLTGDPPAPRRLNPKLSPQAEEIVLHALQRQPEDRYQSAAELKADLEAPTQVQITGYCDRLQAPHWRFGWHETPILAGALVGVGFLSFQVMLFLLLRHWLAHR